MKHLNKYLSLALALVLCLSLAACGESNEDYGDDGSDYNLYGVPDSFEGLVKDSEQMSNLYLYGGAWKGEDGGTLISDTNGDGDPTTVDSGTVELAPDGSEEMYLAVSSQFDDVGYEFTILDHDTLRWGSEFEFYQKMA